MNDTIDKNRIGPLLSAQRSAYDNLTYLLIFTVILYSLIRAFLLSITHDEALTYHIHAMGSFVQVFTFSGMEKPNNHQLNTLLVKVFIGIFGVSEFSLRVPALMGLGLYLWGTYRLLRLFLHKHFFFMGFCLMTLNPFMLDYFSMARGYSLALGFLVIGMYYAFKAVTHHEDEQDIRNTAMALTMLALSVFSNLSFLTVFCSMAVVFILKGANDAARQIKQGQPGSLVFKRFLRSAILPTMPAVLLLAAACVYPIIQMVRTKFLYYGGTEGFWEDTVSSLITATLYNKTYFNLDMVSAIKALIVTVLLCAVSLVLYKVIRRAEPKAADRYLFLVAAILAISSFIIISLHALFDVRYVIERTALFFVPLWTTFLLLLYVQTKTIRSRHVKRSFDSLFVLLTAVMALHVFNTANFTHYYSCKYDASTKEVMAHIVELNKHRGLADDSVRIGTDWELSPGADFYRIKNGLTWIGPVLWYGPEGSFDYYYLRVNPASTELIKKYNLRVIKSYDLPQTYLAVPGIS